jgi:hypothetical protein
MFRFIAKRWAKMSYVFRQHVEAATNDLNAGLATRTAADKRELVAQLTKEADVMDARIKEVSEMEEKGFLLCENGHEFPMTTAFSGIDHLPMHDCPTCHQSLKGIKRSEMSGQEQYESDKERKEAEGIAQSKRDQAKAEEENAANSEKAATYFKDLAAKNRSVAEKIRKL